MTTNQLTAIGIDIDGTITLDPNFYSGFSHACRRNGVIVHIVSARPREFLSGTEEELQELGIIYDELHLLPSMEEAIALCPHSKIDVFDRHFWMKVQYATSRGLSHFIDDNERVLDLFREYAPEVHVYEAMDYQLLGEALIQQATSP